MRAPSSGYAEVVTRPSAASQKISQRRPKKMSSWDIEYLLKLSITCISLNCLYYCQLVHEHVVGGTNPPEAVVHSPGHQVARRLSAPEPAGGSLRKH